MIDGRVFLRSRNLLYQDDVGRDACGIGGVAAREGRPSHEVVRKALLALDNLGVQIKPLLAPINTVIVERNLLQNH